ncbi:hypothetical protein [Nocardia noduli]|uniref:hypothetical protein n=1 Tax=Nocardia noduli TaxID=2815722 RepID=UPI001C21350B|nr:hypothetical protein [Nocardia noduli]
MNEAAARSCAATSTSTDSATHSSAFVSTGLFPPAELDTVDRTIFGDNNNHNFYDQIAWFSTPDNHSLLTDLTYTHHAGHFGFLPTVTEL